MSRHVRSLMLGEARFCFLVGGPFDGRCYPLQGEPRAVLVLPGSDVGASGTVRYVLREGSYRYAGNAAPARPAA